MKHITLTTLIVLVAFMSGFGQQYTDNGKDQTLRGSGRVNPATLAMEFSLPIGNYPGRGINVPISLSYSSKLWRSDYMTSQPRTTHDPYDCVSINFPQFSEKSASGWTSSLAAPYIEYVGWDNIFNNEGHPVGMMSCPDDPFSYYQNAVIKRIIVHLPSGEAHEMRIDDTVHTYETWQSPPAKDGTYYSVDSSNMKYIEDPGNSTYKLLLPDGSYYTFGNSSPYYSGGDRTASRFTDRNGNYTEYNPSTKTWTDTLGRSLVVPIGLTAPTSPTTQTYTMPGLGGGSNVVTYKFYWKKLKDTTSAAESGLTDFDLDLLYMADRASSDPRVDPREDGFLFASEYTAWLHDGGADVFNPIVLKEIELPTGQKYIFTYNLYGEIDKIAYPTGGEETFTYGGAPSVSYLDSLASQMNRGVSERKVYESSGDTTPYEWTYAGGMGFTQTTNPDGTKTERFMHLSNEEMLYGFDNVLSGMQYKELAFSSVGQLLSQKLTHWTNKTFSSGGGWHPRVDYEQSYAYDTSGNGVYSTTSFEYAGDLDYRDTRVLVSKTTQYGYTATSGGSSVSPGDPPDPDPTPVPTPSPSASPVRSTEVTYLQNDSSYSGTASYYTNQNMYGLVTVSKVKDSSGNVVSHSETKYDESGSPTYRGNPTSSWVWDSYKGGTARSDSYPLTTTNAIKTSAVFDDDGNQTSSIDALGNTTTTEFDATYNAFPEEVTSPVPDSSNTHGSNSAFVTTATFDPTTGLPLTTTDANGLKTEITYDSATLRPRYVKYYNGSTQVGPTNETIYHDAKDNYWVKSKGQIDDSHYAESITYFDGLGRAHKTEQVDSGGNIFVTKEFDSDGRVSRVSNPYREVNSDPCYESTNTPSPIVCWTTNTYDNASRVVSVALPDTSTVTTDYGVSTSSPIGITKTITDQAGKKRKGFSDSMGNMVRVVEDPTGSALATDYLFDTLGNLRKTTQGDQSRYFMHSSIGRLLFTKQVEQDTNGSLSATDPVTSNTAWSTKYEYDDNGNITKTRDAKDWYVEATYDALNRIKVRDYSDNDTPDVEFYYDGKYKNEANTTVMATGSVLGKTTGIKSSVSKTNYTAFDFFGRPTGHQQMTDGNTYNTGYEYNIAGTLIEETYPSTRKVRYTTNENGDLTQVQSKKNSSSGFSSYADAFSYDASGNIKKMQLGNGKWETASFNDRQQVTQIGLGSTDSTQDLLKLEFKYDTTSNHDNNGSMLEQKITVPTVGSNSSFTATQTYTYDAFNRLNSATEVVSSQTWKQEFSYDRYGNRNFVTGTGHTTTLGSCSTAVCNPAYETARNRFSTSGQSYTYDANGSITANAAGERFSYDAENHQTKFFTSANSGGTPDATYFYDGEGKRVKKISFTETTIFVYDGVGQLVAEYSTVLASSQQVSYLTQDHLGSPRVITTENGAVTNRKDFMAFGDQASSSQRVSGSSGNGYDPASTREDYTGYEKDSESGLEFAQARYYNPTHGRFTSIDPMTASASIKNPQTFNRYSYVLNSPYKFVDPLGLISESTGTYWCSTCLTSDDNGGYADSPTVTMESQTHEAAHAPIIATNTHEGVHGTQQQAQEPEPPPIPVKLGTFWFKHMEVPYYGDGNIEGTESDVTEVREARSNDPTQIPAIIGSQLPPPGVFHDTAYFVPFSMRSTGASLEGYSYEVTYDNDQGKDVPRPGEGINGRHTIGADGFISIGKYYLTTVKRGSEGFETRLTGDRSVTSTGTITIFNKSGGQVAESTFRATLTTTDKTNSFYTARIVETGRKTALGSWVAPSP